MWPDSSLTVRVQSGHARLKAAKELLLIIIGQGNDLVIMSGVPNYYLNSPVEHDATEKQLRI